jgi:hypothetical protein
MPAKGRDTSMQPALTIARLIGPVFCAIGIAFDSATLRVIAEADGSAAVAVSELPRM